METWDSYGMILLESHELKTHTESASSSASDNPDIQRNASREGSLHSEV